MAFLRAFFVISSLFLSLAASAAPLNELFEKLRDSAMDYETVGTICEQVAKIELYKTYSPEDFEVITGIEYGDRTRTIGELDVVVFQKSTKEAVLVGEVKCWKDASAAREKAMDQRNRFIRSLKKNIDMHDADQAYNKKQFNHVLKYVAIGPKGYKDAGFEIEMENTLRELMDLRRMMLDCQQQGQCAAANRAH
jgi:hypothetical protein